METLEKAPKWMWTLLIITVIILIIFGIMLVLPNIQKRENKQSGLKTATQDKKIEMTLYPDRYVEMKLPYYHWFKFEYDSSFQVKLSGIEDPYDYIVGQIEPDLGEEIPRSVLYMKSLANDSVKVTIVLRPKSKGKFK